MIDEVKNHTCNGKCSKCGNCCGEFLPVTRKEVSKIKAYVKEHNIKPTNRKVGNDIDLRCAFWDKDIGCKIYEVRPYVCRDFKCDHKDWRKRRAQYAKRADYNSINKGKLKKMASFDDLIFDDLSTLILVLADSVRQPNGKVEKEDFIEAVKRADREDILKYMSFELEE